MPIESARIAIVAVIALVGMFLSGSNHVDRSADAAPYSQAGSRR